jgi:hypothetical protein
MLTGQLALLTAAIFAGAAAYVSVAEHPARLATDNSAMLVQWKKSYDRAAVMQAALAVVSGACGLLAFVLTYDWRWLAGAVLIVLNWPYTLLIIMPTNRQLKAVPPDQAGATTRDLVLQWGRLHMARAFLGLAATAAYLWALN